MSKKAASGIEQGGTEIIVVISDTHCGSSVGMMPPTFDDVDEGPALQANKPQRWLWKKWRDFWDTFVPSVICDDAWSLVVNGDAMEGVHHGNTQAHPEPMVHMRIARDILTKPSEQCEDLYFVRGTECHTGLAETDLGHFLGAVRTPEGSYAWDHLVLNCCGKRVSFQHHIGTASRPWLGGYQLQASMVEEQYRAMSRGHRSPDIVVRSHRHVYGEYRSRQGTLVVTPAWQLLTRYGKKVTRDMLSEVGGIILDFRPCKHGGEPLIHSRIYVPDPTPEVQI